MALQREYLEGQGGSNAVSDREAEDAFRAIIRWIGEDPDRDGLAETPARLLCAYREYFAGYDKDPTQVLSRTFSEVDGYDDMIVLRGSSIPSFTRTRRFQ
jgi:GTP cyclohydrolase I